MKPVLVLGDQMEDKYRHFTATRLCPEGPVPVLVKTEPVYSTGGGAGLVANQLNELFRDHPGAMFIPGSLSVKERIFADGRLMLRIDEDSINSQNLDLNYLQKIDFGLYDAVVVSDYNKGAFTRLQARELMYRTKKLNVPVFVDAKQNWEWYTGAFAMFPNKFESGPEAWFGTEHLIQKLGPEGCEVDGVYIPTTEHTVRDVTGAGDVFLAAFVYKYLTRLVDLDQQSNLKIAAHFANLVAGISVEHIGTHIVTLEEIDKHTN